MVAVYGMSDRLPNLNYNDSSGQEMGFTKPYSDDTAKVIDAEVMRIVNEQYERAKEILRKYAKEHNEIRDMLIEKEVIYHDDVEKILGKRKWKSRTDEIIELNKKSDPVTDKNKVIDITPEEVETVDSKSNDDNDDPGTPPPFNPSDN